MIKRTVALTAVAAAAALLAGCGSSSAPAAKGSVAAPDSLVSDSSLTYGTAATFPPFEYKENAKATGFDIDMASELAKSLGLKTKTVDIDFDGLIPALGGKRVDIINSAMYINAERSKVVDFVPYMKVGEAILVKKGAGDTIAKLPDDLSKKTIAVTRGAIGEKYMEDFNDQLKKAGLPTMKILTLPNNQDALAAVRSGRADGFDTSTPGAAYTLTQTKDFEQAATFALDTQIGIAVRKGDNNMKKAVEAALKEFVDSGRYAELMKKYNLPTDGSIV